MSNDVDLLKKIVHKDRDAFETIYKAYFRKLYTLSFRYLRDEAIAEELTNDVFMMLWENAGKLAINQSLGAYLSRSVINLSLTHLKKNQRLKDHNQNYLKDLNPADDSDQTDHATLYESKLLMIESILKELPPQCRKIVLMSKYDKMKQQEIADQLGISIKTVKNHLTIAYDKIRVALAKREAYVLFLIGFLFFSLGLLVQFVII
ncbi:MULTISPECIES: RNA polymerase sigma-70 factor [Sphingobacterium]|uniref:RNA polymerase sigma-70 factor n=1 Tax=Sphingobacterium athyrii TaxID=2152717 RepID=A0A363NSA6_9SPHI|nr:MULTISPECIES: RNA polymerase sigma-70 factor [Sphingobacterium]PUV23696.1 RNA polymerase sigma-70 factor [Sphingobacterium athyrii]QIH36274.1 RNA polymerase sigma-70 factor [Sphingobacterium sp. DR205]